MTAEDVVFIETPSQEERLQANISVREWKELSDTVRTLASVVTTVPTRRDVITGFTVSERLSRRSMAIAVIAAIFACFSLMVAFSALMENI